MLSVSVASLVCCPLKLLTALLSGFTSPMLRSACPVDGAWDTSPPSASCSAEADDVPSRPAAARSAASPAGTLASGTAAAAVAFLAAPFALIFCFSAASNQAKNVSDVACTPKLKGHTRPVHFRIWHTGEVHTSHVTSDQGCALTSDFIFQRLHKLAELYISKGGVDVRLQQRLPSCRGLVRRRCSRKVQDECFGALRHCQQGILQHSDGQHAHLSSDKAQCQAHRAALPRGNC